MKYNKKMLKNETLEYLTLEAVNMDTRTIYLHDEINYDTCQVVCKWLHYFAAQDEKKEITLEINSPGGYIYDAMAIVDMITTLSCPVTTIASGLCASGATLISVVGTKRLARPNATFMLHELSDVEMDRHSQIKNNVRHNDQLMRQMYDIYEQNSKLTRTEMQQKMLKDWYMTAKEAFEKGLIDNIVEPKKR